VGYEVDFLPVGSGESSGDAIAFRYGNLFGPRSEQRVGVIDGGTLESGQALVDHILGFYRTNVLDHAFLSHPDLDHASGLRIVLEKLDVQQLVMHLPWAHSNAIGGLWKDGRFIQTKLDKRLRETLECAHELESFATGRIRIHEPFAGTTNGDQSILVLGPTQAYYEDLLPHFLDTPPPDLGKLLSTLYPPPPPPPPRSYGLLDMIASGALRVPLQLVDEDRAHELLDDTGITSARNNSSMILLLTVDGHKLLFTGDAGIQALTLAADFALSIGVRLDDLEFLDVPHHGSRRNLGPSVLARVKARTAFISAAGKTDTKHPSKRVVNALLRRGTTVYATQGNKVYYYLNAPRRPGWVYPPPSLTWSNRVET